MKKHLNFLILSLLLLSNYYCTANKLSKLFSDNNLNGSITIYDSKNKTWIFSDKDDSTIETLPASTFKIINSLILLEEKVIKPGEFLKWDGTIKTFKGKSVSSWNADTDMENAFKNSTIWFYTELSQKIDKAKYKEYLTEIEYGNLNLNETNIDFWNYGKLAISPKNQIEVLIKLYNSELPFSDANMTKVKSFMLQEKNEKFKLYAKTGWGMRDENDIGWYIGYIETDNNTYFFATRIIEKSNNLPANFSNARKEITLKAFNLLSII